MLLGRASDRIKPTSPTSTKEPASRHTGTAVVLLDVCGANSQSSSLWKPLLSSRTPAIPASWCFLWRSSSSASQLVRWRDRHLQVGVQGNARCFNFDRLTFSRSRARQVACWTTSITRVQVSRLRPSHGASRHAATAKHVTTTMLTTCPKTGSTVLVCLYQWSGSVIAWASTQNRSSCWMEALRIHGFDLRTAHVLRLTEKLTVLPLGK